MSRVQFHDRAPHWIDVSARLNGEAGVRDRSRHAGDRAESGPIAARIESSTAGALRRRGIRNVGIAGYPGGHPRIGDEELHRALDGKDRGCGGTGLDVEIVTQFCFDARAILDFIARLRALGSEHRVRVGWSGRPTSPR